MRIVHVVTRFLRAGTERNIARFTEWERDAGHDVALVVGDDSVPDLVPQGVRLVQLSSLRREPSPVWDPLAVLALRRVLRPDVDVVHTHQSKAGILGRLAADPGSTVVHTVHMPSFGPAFGRASPAFETLERWAAGRTDHMVAVSEELRTAYLDAGIGRADAFSVLRSAARAEDLLALRDRSAAARTAARQRLGVTDDRSVILTVGALEPRKRTELIIQRVAPLLRGGRAVLVVAGEGSLADHLHRHVSDAGLDDVVRLVGHVEPVDDAYLAADAFVLASETEGLAQVLIQALAAGLPVVSTPVEGLAEIEGAPIVAVGPDGDGMAEALSHVLADPPPPSARAALEPWTTAAVVAAIAAFHDELARVGGTA